MSAQGPRRTGAGLAGLVRPARPPPPSLLSVAVGAQILGGRREKARGMCSLSLLSPAPSPALHLQPTVIPTVTPTMTPTVTAD